MEPSAKPVSRPRVGLPAGSLVFLAALPFLAPATGVTAWNQFRGANGQGVAEDPVPSHFGPELNVVWKTDVPPGHSSPVFADRQIYLTASDGESLWTLALDRDRGVERWRRKAPRPRTDKIDNRNHPAAASPVTDGQSVFVLFGDFGLLAYSERGEELWRLPLGPFNNIYGIGASPILIDDLLVLPVDQQSGSYLLAVDKHSGRERWRTARPLATSGHSTPVIYRPSDGPPQILLSGSFRLTGYSLEGRELWWVDGLSFELKSTPAIADGLLFINGYGSQLNEPGESYEVPAFDHVVSTADLDDDGAIDREEIPQGLPREWFSITDLDGDGGLDSVEWGYFGAALESRNSMMAIRLPKAAERGNLTASHVVWRYFEKVPQLPSPLVYRGVLYMINDRGIVTTFRPEDGTVVQQGRIEGAIDSYYSSPVASDGKVFFAGRGGNVAVLPANGKIEPITINDLDETIYATPAIVDERLYVRTTTALYAFGGEGNLPQE